MMRVRRFGWSFAIALEAIGCGAIIAGVAIEVLTKAETGYIVITGGSAAVAFGAMIFSKLVKGRRNR